MKHTFTRFISLMLALVLTLLCIPALAEGDAAPANDAAVPEGYPTLRIDPATGKPYDLGGQTIYLCNFYEQADWETQTPGTSEEQAKYDYQKWLQNTYNFKLSYKVTGDWTNYADQMLKFAKKPDGSLRFYTLNADWFSQALNAKALADWSKSDQIDVTDPKWNVAVTDFATIGTKVFGVSRHLTSNNAILYFNKSILEKAKVDWNTIYDMQKNGTWTWEAFENILKKVKKVKNVSAFIGESSCVYLASVLSNDGSFFQMKDGKLALSANGKKTTAALKWAKDIQKKYAYKRTEKDDWNYITSKFLGGKVAFFLGADYQVLSNSDGLNKVKDNWGAVAFPKGPSAKNGYVNASTDMSIDVIPNVYDEDTVAKMTMVYDLWFRNGFADTQSALMNGYKTNNPDQQTLEETIPFFLNPANSRLDKAFYLGNLNTALASPLLWQLDSAKSISKAIKAATPEWNKQLKKLNKVLQALQK